VEITGWLNLQDWKVQDWKLTDNIAGLETDGLDNRKVLVIN